MEFTAAVSAPLPSNTCTEPDVRRTLASTIHRELDHVSKRPSGSETGACFKQIYVDLSSDVDIKATKLLGLPTSSIYFEILADYYLQGGGEVERLLSVCNAIWGHSYAPAIFALLLHKWLLKTEEAEEHPQRRKHLNVLLTGCWQLFWEDLQSCSTQFHSVYNTLHKSDHAFQALPFKMHFLSILGPFLPYYRPHHLLRGEVMELPFEEDGFTPDTLFIKFTELMKQSGAGEKGLARYLAALASLGGHPILTKLKIVTHLQFQAQLYSLTSHGGGGGLRDSSTSVRHAAFHVLDAFYPQGGLTRRLVSNLVKIVQPSEWPRPSARLFLAPILWLVSWCTICFRCFSLIFSRPVRR